MAEPQQLEEFVRQLTEHQRVLYIYILSLLGHSQDADEVLQNTNLVLWRKSSDYQPGTNFGGWATRIAQFEVLAYRKKQRRESLRFESDVVELLAAETVDRLEQVDSRRQALAACLERLRPCDRDLVKRRYHLEQSVAEMAEQLGRSLAAMYQALHRVRASLLACVNSSQASEVSR